ncbi:MAG: hypothetical protein GXP53_03875 [Deltaproteobacteria bacterium]|nr:hypothetical protein [Deltaproteobacteria bacterium]
MKTDDTIQPDCFGDIGIVFPMGEDGFRESPEACMACAHKTECLRTAIARPAGLAVREEKLRRAYESRSISFFKRWSEKKMIAKRRKKTSP